jgi:hypothetical protein
MDRLVLDQLAGEALRELLHAVQGTLFCRSTAERLRRSVEPLLPLVQGLGPHSCQRSAGELGELAARVREALDLARRAAASPRWNVYRAAQLSRRMEAADRGIARWLERHAPAHVIGGVRRLRDEADARIGRLERRVEEIAAAAQPPAPPALSVPVAPHKGVLMPMEAPLAKPAFAAVPMEAPLGKAAFAAVPMEVPPHKGMAMSVPVPLKAAPAKAGVMAMDMDLTEGHEDEGMVGGGVKVAKEKVKEMVMSGGGGWEVVGISGMGGSGKTTLAMEIFRDHKVRGKENRDQILTIFSFNPFQIVRNAKVASFSGIVLPFRAKIPSFHELLGAKFSKLEGMASSVVGLRAYRAIR